jgi:urea transport system substrate-binding protein
VDDVVVIRDPLEARLLVAEPGQAVRVGLLVPLSGTRGMLGPAILTCAQLAAAEINTAGGLLGQAIEFVLVDSGKPARTAIAEVAGLVRDGAISALIGTHSSDVRGEVIRAVAARIPYIYARHSEGGQTSPGTYMAGATPDQLRPPLTYLAQTRRARRWAFISNDEVSHHRAKPLARRYLQEAGASLVAARHLPSVTDPQPLLDLLSAAKVDAVLLLLVGRDLVTFNQAFTASGMDRLMPRLSITLEENGLLGIGGDETGELYAVHQFFATLPTDAACAFVERYTARYGPEAPVPGSHAEATYTAVHLLTALARRAGSLRTSEMDAVADGTTFNSGRGTIRIRNRHLDQKVHLARANQLEFDVIRSF